MIERYRRRWPVILKEGDSVYVIDDNLNLFEKALVGTHIDFEALLRKREQRNKLVVSPVVLWIHDTGAMYNHDAVVNPEIFSNFRDGQLLRIHCPRNIQPQQQQSQSTGNDQQDQKKQHDHHQGQQTQVQTQQQAQAQQSEQSKDMLSIKKA
ncbi:hypothetical protein G6F42_026719 [Rhizopus arrhizus]|nr:hypothetical protein G6F42_026719 [Rhizopus arrhizus]